MRLGIVRILGDCLFEGFDGLLVLIVLVKLLALFDQRLGLALSLVRIAPFKWSESR